MSSLRSSKGGIANGMTFRRKQADRNSFSRTVDLKIPVGGDNPDIHRNGFSTANHITHRRCRTCKISVCMCNGSPHLINECGPPFASSNLPGFPSFLAFVRAPS